MNGNLSMQVDSKRESISLKEQKRLLECFVKQIPEKTKNILILPPDYTRKHSGAGRLTAILYDLLKEKYNIEIMPALGTHSPMTKEEIIDMFGSKIPLDLFKIHDFRRDIVKIGQIPAEFVKKVSAGKVKKSINVAVNKRLFNKKDQLIISIGQVLPHAVVGMANYNKNILVGCGGSEIINISHFVGAVYGMEHLLGRDHSPVRKLFDYAEEKFLTDVNIKYILTVNSIALNPGTGTTNLLGLFTGETRGVFEAAVKLSQKYNITRLDKPVRKMVVFMDGEEFKSTWLACKAIYRTRLAIADGGELIVLAPGLNKFGEFTRMDNLIRRYGYVGKEKILQYVDKYKDLENNLAGAAHLIHGSTEGRFRATFATDLLARKELTGVNFSHLGYKEARRRYPPEKMEYGYNKLKTGDKVFFIENPTTGLWTTADRIK